MPPASRRAPSIFHCLEGSSVVAITSRDRPCSCYSVDGFWIFTFKNACRAERSEKIFVRSSQKNAPSRFFSWRARAKNVSLVSLTLFSPKFVSLKFVVFPPQLKKQNDKESARDMTGYKPSNFDKGFREGKGWGDLVRRGGSRDK